MDSSPPTARILPSRTASACAFGCSGSSVAMVASRNTRSAGCSAGGKPGTGALAAKEAAVNAIAATGSKLRNDFIKPLHCTGRAAARPVNMQSMQLPAIRDLAVEIRAAESERRELRIRKHAVGVLVRAGPVRIIVEYVVAAQREGPVVQEIVRVEVQHPLGRIHLVEDVARGTVIGDRTVTGQRAAEFP